MNENRPSDLSPDSVGLGGVVEGAMTRVSAPASTGGAGTTFEQHVGAYWLAQLLIGSIPPILIETTVAEVGFQTERLGWHTDDFLIACTAGEAVRNLAGQVKRRFTVSASDRECAQAIGDFWRDLNGPHFSKDEDRLALVTLRGHEYAAGALRRSARLRTRRARWCRFRAAAPHTRLHLRYRHSLLRRAADNHRRRRG